MSILIAQLAFASPELLATAKLAVPCASGVAGPLGLALGHMLLSPREPERFLSKMAAVISKNASKRSKKK